MQVDTQELRTMTDWLQLSSLTDRQTTTLQGKWRAAADEIDRLRTIVERLETKPRSFLDFWLKATPRPSFGDSAIAYDAQVRIMEQFVHWFEHGDNYIQATIDLHARQAAEAKL